MDIETTDAGHPERSEFATTDPDEAQAFIDQMYKARIGRAVPLGRTSPMAISQVRAGGISSVDMTMPPDLTLHLDGTDDLSISTLIAGTSDAEYGDRVERFEAGQVCLGAFTGGDYVVRCRALRVSVMTVPAAALAQVAGALPGHDPDAGAPALRFPALAPVSPAGGEQWKRAAEFVRGVLADDSTAASPLILGSSARLLAATALAVFPNNLLPDHGLSESAATPDTVRRAEEFMHAYAHTDIFLNDIARAAFVTPRAVQLAFRRHHDTTPMRYLRRIRLARAHQDLLEADPDSSITVTAVAARWGFAGSSRFAAGYLAAYGVHPGETLRTHVG